MADKGAPGPGGRGRSRARARAVSQQQQQGDKRRPGVEPSVPIPSTGAVPAAGDSRGRVSRGVAAPAAAQSRPGGAGVTEPVGQLAAEVQAMALEAPKPTSRGEGRGAWRGRRAAEMQIVRTRPPTANVKIGTYGKPVDIVCNYFKIESRPNWTIYHYHVDFVPDQESLEVRRYLVNSLSSNFNQFLFDGMALFVSHKLEKEEFMCQTRAGANVKVQLKLTRELHQDDPVVLQILGIQLRKIFRNIGFQQIGRHYFDVKNVTRVEEHNLELWPGFTSAIHLHENNVPLLCADVAFKMVRNENVLDLMQNLFNRSHGRGKEDCIREIVGSVVMTRYNNKTYKVDDVDWKSTPLSTFKNAKTGKDQTFLEYFQMMYGVSVHDTKQPLLVHRPKKRDLRRGMSETVLLLPELCFMTGLSQEMRENFNVMRDIATHTRVPPDQRYHQLREFMKRIKGDPTICKELIGWNLSFAPDLLQLKGREHPPEKIMQANNKSFFYDQSPADWSREMRSNALLHAVSLTNWIVIVTRRDMANAQNFVGSLSRVCPPMGINIATPRIVPLESDRLGEYASALKRECKEGLQLVMCVVPNNRKDRYDTIKQLCCIDRGVHSQVIVNRTINNKGKLMSVATKVAIQLNCKLGGAAWTVELPLSNIMIVGYDSYHDSSQRGMSVGAVVASMDPQLTRYYSQVKFQTNSQEMLDGLLVHMRSALQKYRDYRQKTKSTCLLPERIIIFRDGVGEGQLQQIYDTEISQIMNAFKTMGESYMPKLTFIVVTKRINTRLFRMQRNGCQNPLPGTIVDTEITKDEWYDFFIVSQSVRQGTVSPTHYNVIFDESGLRPDHIQRITYKMTHLYYNWPGTVRSPAPCVYAHKLAFLTGQSLHTSPHQNLADTLFYL